MDKYRVVALMGKSASGKDTLLNEVCKKYPLLNRKVSTTTRPMRENEQEGKDYYFVDDLTFAEKVVNFEMLEANDFNGWFYGTEIKSLSKDTINIGIFNPEGVVALKEDSRIDLVVFYVIASNKTRLIRSLSRESNPDIEEILRRYRTDEEDFSDLEFDFVPLINNGDRTMEDLVDQIRDSIVHRFGQNK